VFSATNPALSLEDSRRSWTESAESVTTVARLKLRRSRPADQTRAHRGGQVGVRREHVPHLACAVRDAISRIVW
jgi:hypothetical protein